MEMTESQKEKVHIINDGYRYRKDRVYTDGGVSWRCCKRDCRGRMKVTTEDARTIISEHNHAPHPEENEAKRIVAEIRRRAVATVKANNSAKFCGSFVADSEYVTVVHGFSESDREKKKEK